MIKSFKADLYRLLRSKGLYICLALTMLIYALTIGLKADGGISFGIMPQIDGLEAKMKSMKLDVLQLRMNFNYYFLLIMPVFMIIIPEFSEGTFKNSITSVCNKKNFFIRKFVFAEVVSMIIFIVGNVGFYVVNRLLNGSVYSSSVGDFMEKFVMEIPIFVAVIAFFVFLAFLFKKASVFNSVTIVLPLVINVVAGLLCMVDGLEKTVLKAYNYEVSTMLNIFVFETEGKEFFPRCLVGAIIITIVLFLLGLSMFDKKELA